MIINQEFSVFLYLSFIILLNVGFYSVSSSLIHKNIHPGLHVRSRNRKSIFPQILFRNFFHSGEEKFYFNHWYGITFLGEICRFLMSKFLISSLRVEGQINLDFFSTILCLFSIFIYFLIEDPPPRKLV